MGPSAMDFKTEVKDSENKPSHQCDHCGHMVHQDELREVRNERLQKVMTTCNTCRRKSYHKCDRCANITNVFFAMKRDELVCHDCYAANHTYVPATQASQFPFLRN